ncbi:MAG: type II glyceraldehyde-3-phosphate dehydrogenase [Halobacteriaceae archaeon]
MIRVGINGYGTIGKRVADAVVEQPDMELTGVAKRSPNFEARTASQSGIDVYAAEGVERFSDSPVDPMGVVADLVDDSDVIVDATPAGVGAQYSQLYREHDTPAVFQGGEDADVAEVSFNARASFDRAMGADSVRVVSCNTTAMSRTLTPLTEHFEVEKARGTIIRRGGDPNQPDRGPINDILPDPISMPSHHGEDVKTVLPDLEIETAGVKVPATLMHLQSLNVTFADAPTAEEVRNILADEDRIAMVPGEADFAGCAALKEYALDVGRPRGDVWEAALWADSIAVAGRDLYLFQAVHQESDVVPENVDAIRAVSDAMPAAESRETTNESLGVGLDFGL